MSYFCFDGEQFNPCKTLADAMGEAQDAIDCYGDQCDPTWPEEVHNICYGMILGHAVERELTPEETDNAVRPEGYGDFTWVDYKIHDPYNEHMKDAAEDSPPGRYDYCELVRAIEELPSTMLPGIVATAIAASIREKCWHSDEGLRSFVERIAKQVRGESKPVG